MMFTLSATLTAISTSITLLHSLRPLSTDLRIEATLGQEMLIVTTAATGFVIASAALWMFSTCWFSGGRLLHDDGPVIAQDKVGDELVDVDAVEIKV